MLKIEEISQLIQLVNESSLDQFEYENEGTVLKMKKNSGVTVQQVATEQVVPAAQPVVAVQAPVSQSEVIEEAAVDASLHKIVSPMVGTFYNAPSPDKDAYVEVGSKVKANSVVCIVEAMKLFNEIEAEVDGEIVEILVNDGQLVEYGQPLFLVKAN